MANCARCNRYFQKMNSNQRYCSKSCSNCAKSSARISDKDFRQFRTQSSWYATRGGYDEVARGSHSKYFEMMDETREEWMGRHHCHTSEKGDACKDKLIAKGKSESASKKANRIDFLPSETVRNSTVRQPITAEQLEVIKLVKEKCKLASQFRGSDYSSKLVQDIKALAESL